VRAEEIASLAAEIAKAKSAAYVEAQLTRTSTLARSDIASQQSLDQAKHDVASARGRRRSGGQPRRRKAGPTREQLAIADAQVRPRHPHSQCSNGASTRRRCEPRPMALSA
jgi:HlyD family secretion protein